ncbi:C-24(28) sterol reductase [Lithohypha guttulata]|uniref:Delta(24(24(1)))-sterol reductase n=1 Tax=Lithohypha guttulata TaxID=1690604 RepID=A0ABR0KHS6_9EURO|nr:C-24(28) sterol reductase [Lithohypha guttulata]
MTITTRSQTGKTPRKPEHPGYVETPGTYKKSRSRKSMATASDDSDAQEVAEDSMTTLSEARKRTKNVKSEGDMNGDSHAHTNGHAKGHMNGHAKPPKGKVVDGWEVGTDPKVDRSGRKEFGGSFGVSAMMIGFPLLMYYMWIGATYYDGHLPTREPGQSMPDFLRHLGELVYEGAFPHAKAWTMYWVMFAFESFLYIYAPGIWTKGKPLPHEGGKALPYYCSGIASWWITNGVAFMLHFTGIFPLYTIIDEFGPIMSVAILSGFGVSIIAYVSALYRGKQHRMTGDHIYDFFMGAELNPRMFGILDFKMFFEVRLPWYILYLTTLGMCARQYERYGYVSGEAMLLLLAHFLYANACSKGEELIPITWDMYYEKWGFMLIFWNMAGVPLSYCHCTVYLANHHPDEYAWNKYAIIGMHFLYIFVYWIWDTCNGQKNRFRGALSGSMTDRWTFPPMPYGEIKNPKVIESDAGPLLVDGWCKDHDFFPYELWILIIADRKARKLHYTCDVFFALSWGAVTGFNSPFPWFYPFFFTCMIIHRAIRDIERCRIKYGSAWTEYERQVPYLFIPYVY